MVISETEGFIKGFVFDKGRFDIVMELFPYTECRMLFNKNKPARDIKLGDYANKKVKVTVELIEE